MGNGFEATCHLPWFKHDQDHRVPIFYSQSMKDSNRLGRRGYRPKFGFRQTPDVKRHL